jgi:hypothetical protein
MVWCERLRHSAFYQQGKTHVVRMAQARRYEHRLAEHLAGARANRDSKAGATGMTVDHDALRARVAELVRTGELPARPGLIAEVSIGGHPDAVCLVCAAAGAQVAYGCWDGRRFALHCRLRGRVGPNRVLRPAATSGDEQHGAGPKDHPTSTRSSEKVEQAIRREFIRAEAFMPWRRRSASAPGRCSGFERAWRRRRSSAPRRAACWSSASGAMLAGAASRRLESP